MTRNHSSRNLLLHWGSLAIAFLLFGLSPVCSQAQNDKASKVSIVEKNGELRLNRDGKPYFIKGAGGSDHLKLLKESGGNSIRTWGADNLEPLLDQAQKLGLTVTVGIWLGHKEHGFSYDNADQVSEQYENVRKAVLKYRYHPALLMWALGNEMEDGEGKSAAIWSAINNLATLVKSLDPNHPTMTVLAEIGGDKVKNLHRLCPAIDVIGINSYGGAASIPERYTKAGGTKPYIVTEFGPQGEWELAKNDWGVVAEATSSAKTVFYRKAYEGAIRDKPLCLGSYAFVWGDKQETSPTWFGMLLHDGSRLGVVDTMQELWTGAPPEFPCPTLKSLKIVGKDQVKPGAIIRADLDLPPSKSGALKVEWVLQNDEKSPKVVKTKEGGLPIFPDAVISSDSNHAEVKMPKQDGIYRLFAYVHDTHGGAAVANVLLQVQGGDAPVVSKGATAKLPLVVFSEGGHAASLPFTPSGYMGNAQAIKMDENCTDNPHSGKTCMRAQFTSKSDWGGVIWQNPANDWGDAPGGMNLTGATKLTFWARGEKGGETIGFLCGTLGKDKPFFDTAIVKLEAVSLTKGWKQYSIDLKGKDLSRIKSGFGWSGAANGNPFTFYLDDIQYEK